jgi:hypothetical protein
MPIDAGWCGHDQRFGRIARLFDRQVVITDWQG